MLILGENIYITIDNVSVSGKGSCPEDVPDPLLDFLQKSTAARTATFVGVM